MPRIRVAIDIRVPQDRVFNYVTTPAHWPGWHLSSLGVSGATDHSLQPGERLTEDFRIGRRRGRVTWTVQERVAPQRWVIAGRVAGGGEGTITYALTSAGGVTHYERDFVYRLPNPLLALLDRLVLRGRMEADARHSLQRLKEVLESNGPD